VAEGGRRGAIAALIDGISRVVAAPAILTGTIAVVLLYGPNLSDARHAFGAVLISVFLLGGILDRYARGRPTRARGFFGACGAHVSALLRMAGLIAVVLLAFHAAVGEHFANEIIHKTAFVVALLLGVIVVFAKVRVAVEDRRSALGALLAGARFVARNPAGLVLVLGLAVVMLLTTLAYERIAGNFDGWTAFFLRESWIGAETFFVLATFASAISLFQSRLAHAGYTAAPRLTWPDSPAAETIANAPPTFTP
jgi:hypothetical protein